MVFREERMTQKKARPTTAPHPKRSPVAERIAARVTEWVGSSKGMTAAVAVIVVWAALGPVFGWSDTWQLAINTGTTIVTFLMVFLIQRTQNRDTQAIHLKLDELIRVTKGARNVMLDLEHMDDEHLKRLRDIYERLGTQARGEHKDRS
jgi:low affinity Fe/Cu permease